MVDEIEIGGLNLNFFESAQFEEQFKEFDRNICARNTLRVLMMGQINEWKSLIQAETKRAVLINYDSGIAKALRQAMQEGFLHIFAQLKNQLLPEQQQIQAELFINNCMMFLPYFDLTPFEFISLPQCIDGEWQLINYKIVPIELTQTSGFGRLFISEIDRVWAFGFEPIGNKKALPQLVFPGTSYPQGQGFFTTLDADLAAFQTPGENLFNSGMRNLRRFSEKQMPKKIVVCGTSLGGSLSHLFAMHFGNRIERVVTLNPPGIYKSFWTDPFKLWEELTVKPKVYIQRQGNDQISLFGMFHSDWYLLEVKPPLSLSSNAISDHILNYAGFAETTFQRISAQEDYAQHKMRNFLWYTVIRSIFHFFIFSPFRYLILPPLRFITNRVLQSIFILPILFLCTILAFTISPPLIVGVFSCLACLLTRQQFQSDRQYDIDKEKSSSKMRSGLIILATVALVLASCALTLFIPIITAIFVAILIPVITFVCNNLVKCTDKVFSEDKREGERHASNLARNETLDIYKNEMDAEFTYQELYDYYTIRQCVVKDKPALQATGSSHGFFSVDGVIKTKQEIIQECSSLEIRDKIVIRTAPIAKIYEMQETLRIHQQVGISAKSLFNANYQAYKRGKVVEAEPTHEKELNCLV